MEAGLFGVSVHFSTFIGVDTQTAVIISERDMALESTSSQWSRAPSEDVSGGNRQV